MSLPIKSLDPNDWSKGNLAETTVLIFLISRLDRDSAVGSADNVIGPLKMLDFCHGQAEKKKKKFFLKNKMSTRTCRS